MKVQANTVARKTDHAPTSLWATPAQQLAVRFVVDRTGFSPSLAATVASLARLGGSR
jgi:hypothetical protein